MANNDIRRQKIKSQIAAIKKINDNPRSFNDSTYDQYKDRLESTDGAVKKSVNDFTSKLKGRTDNKKDIFGELLDTVEGFMGTDKEDPVNPKSKPNVKGKILRYAKNSANITLKSSRQIVNDEVKKSFFGGQGICNSNKLLTGNPVSLSPQSFDIMNMLKVAPNTLTGKLMYESTDNLGANDIKFNRTLYGQFDLVSSTPIASKDGTVLFNLGWTSGTQMYNVTGLNPSGTRKVGDFIDNYYSTIEYPDVDYIMKTAMQMALQGDGTEPSAFNDGMKNVNRLITKLCSICGSPVTTQPLLNNTSNQLTEDEYDTQNYFDFDDVEGIDLDDEDSRLRRVLKFRDCNNFEIPINSNHMEDFGYLLTKKTMDENVLNTLNKTATDAYEQSDGSVSLDGYQISLMNSYILKIPKAIISSALSPKMFFPIVVAYQDTNSLTPVNAKTLMKTLSNLFFNIIKAIYWKFLKEFWNFIKRDLLKFLKETAESIIKNKLKKIKGIITGLIQLLTKALQTNIGSCSDLFNSILDTISAIMNKKVNIPVPGLLLGFSDNLPGYSSDRAYMNIVERMGAAGINLEPLYGTENKLLSVIKAVVDGHSEEMDVNSYVSVSNKEIIIPTPLGAPIVIPPGLLNSAGKTF